MGNPLTKLTGKKTTSNKVISTPPTSARLINAVLGKGSESNSVESDFENNDDISIVICNNIFVYIYITKILLNIVF